MYDVPDDNEVGIMWAVRHPVNALRNAVSCRAWCMFLAAVTLARAASGEGALSAAIRRADSATVTALLRAGAPINAADADGMTPLHWAVQLHRVEDARALIAANADVTRATRYGVTPLILACINGSLPLVERLLQAGADPNTALPNGETALMTAARTGALGPVRVLLSRGAAVDLREQIRGQTALMWAAAEGHVPIVRALIEAGAAVDVRSTGGFTPLLFAVRHGHADVVRVLVAAGASPRDVVSPDGASPTARNSALALAIINKRYDVALLLLDQGADAAVSDPRGSLLHAVAWVRRPGADIGVSFVPPPDQEAERLSLELAKSLLAHGANPNARIAWKETPYDTDGTVRQPPDIIIGRNYLSFVGATPFYLAAKHGDFPFMRLLAAHGADPTLSTAQGITPLMAAAGLGFWDGESPGPTTGVPESHTLEAVRLCVELGNDVHAVTDFGDVELVADGETLLQKVPFHITKDHDQEVGDMRWGGSTALHGAAYRGLEPVVRFLVSRGARVDARNDLGWTPLTVSGGFFVANNYHEPDIRMSALLQELMRDARTGGR